MGKTSLFSIDNRDALQIAHLLAFCRRTIVLTLQKTSRWIRYLRTAVVQLTLARLLLLGRTSLEINAAFLLLILHMANGFKIIRREQSVRSRQHRGVLSQVICERDELEILRTEMESGSVCDSREFGDFSSAHYVIDGTPVFRTSHECADLMSGDSVVFPEESVYTISNGAPTRVVFLSVLFKPCATGVQPTQGAAKEPLA